MGWERVATTTNIGMGVEGLPSHLTSKEYAPKGSQPLAFYRLVKRSWTQRR